MHGWRIADPDDVIGQAVRTPTQVPCASWLRRASVSLSIANASASCRHEQESTPAGFREPVTWTCMHQGERVRDPGATSSKDSP